MQAAANIAAPYNPHRTTADIATQYVLADLDSEPLGAHGHQQLEVQNRVAALRSGVQTDSPPTRPSGFASTEQLRDSPEALTQAQDYPSRVSTSAQADSHMLTQQYLRDTAYSLLEDTVTVAEVKAMHKQAESKALLGRSHSPDAHWVRNVNTQAAQQHQQAAGRVASKAADDTDDISILVTAACNEDALPESALQWTLSSPGNTSARRVGSGGVNPLRSRVGLGVASPYAVRSPLQSIHKEHSSRPSSARASSTGRHSMA